MAAEQQEDTVWTRDDSQLRLADINTAMVHLYRAEVDRANNWRNRLDVTTNWALVATGAAISLAFSQQNIHHSIIILNALLITLFLVIEVRRYRYYELWSYRVRLMETDFYAPMLVPPYRPDPDLAQKLTESLLDPQFPISLAEAFGRRLRRNYLWVYLVLLGVWFAKLVLYPQAVVSWDQLAARARMGIAPGELVMAIVLVFYAALVVIAWSTRRLRHAVGEVFPRYGTSQTAKNRPTPAADPQIQAEIPPTNAYPLLAVVTAEQLELILPAMAAQFKRSATRLDPNNTTGTQATLLLPVTVSEIASLKALVHDLDPKGVVVVIPAEDIFQQSSTIQKAAETAAQTGGG